MENNNKLKISQILAYISMGFAVLSLPFYFLGTFSIEAISGKEYITLISFFKAASGDDGEKVLIVIAIFLLVSIVSSVAAAVLNIFKLKAGKITGTVLSIISLVIDIAVVIRVCTSSEDILVSLLEIRPDFGGIIMLISVIAAAVLAVSSMILFIKGSKMGVDDNGAFKVIHPEILGGNDDTIVMNNNSQNYDNSIPLNAGITFLSGCCAGYNAPINNGSIVIGKDPSQCSIIIDKSYTNVSRKHCEIRFDYNTHEYVVTDFSANGTFTENEVRLNRGVPSNLPSGTILTLAKTNNILKLN